MFSTVYQKRDEESNKVLEYVNESRKKGFHTDVCIKAGEKSFQAHRLILSCCSGYFRTVFLTDTKEKYGNTVEIEEVDATSLELLIYFIYTGKLDINQKNVFELLPASDYLQIDEAQQLCLHFLSNSISIETWFKILKMTDLYQNNYILHKAFPFLNNNFALISSKIDFKLQSKPNLLYLLSHLDSCRVNQRLLYDAITGWVKHEESRKDDFAELFQILDLNKFSSSFLTDTISTDTLVIENHLCTRLVMNALSIKLHEVISNNPSKILSIGGYITPAEVCIVYNNDQEVYPALPDHFFPHFSLKYDNFVYCHGRCYDSKSYKVFRMKLYEAKMKWEEVYVASREVIRDSSAAVVYKNGIAVTGSSYQSSKSAEFFDPSLNQWSVLPSMNSSRREHSLVSCNGCLFCLGGTDEYDDNFDDGRLSASVEMLGDVTGTWQHIQPMKTSRIHFAAVNCMDTVYAIGGRNYKCNAIKSVEKYNFKFKKWVNVDDMNIERWGHSACIMQNKIFVVGGMNINGNVHEIECYDPSSDNWSIVGNTNLELYHHSILVI